MILSKEFIKHVKIMALRKGLWFKLHQNERILINLIISTLRYVKSNVLINLILKILDKISPKLLYMYKAYQIGLKIVKIRIKEAKQIGYKYAEKLSKDINYIIYLGVWYLNTSSYYRPNVNMDKYITSEK